MLKKRGLFILCPAAHLFALLGAAVIALFLAVRHNYALMRQLSDGFVQPLHHGLAKLTSFVPFSLAEMLIAALSVTASVYIIYEILSLIRKKGKGRRLYRLFMRLAALALVLYAGFCLLWGVYYYGDGFIDKSGLVMEDISAEDLELVTVWFADRLNRFAPQVARNEEGFCRTDREAVLSRSPTIFRAVSARYPCLTGPEVPAKRMVFSRFMSIIDFTGFFSPYTAEANVNADFPPALFAATVAHELSHQRGVAKEQEANFVAVLASLESGDVDYSYSACLLAYIHLSNALYAADPAALRLINQGLVETVQRDLEENNSYWARFESPVQTVTDAVYEGFLQSYEQTLGMRSYGACVDLLVNYYAQEAAAYFGVKS